MTDLIILSPTSLQREAWRALLSPQPDITVTGTVGEASALAGYPRTGEPTTVLIDVPDPRPDFARLLEESWPDLGLLFLVHSYELREIVPLLQAGANGCVSRDDSVDDLASAIIAAGRGEIALPPPIAARVLATLARGGPIREDPSEPLSDREIEVLRLLAGGLTNKDIAQALFLSVRTVEAHLRSIFAKLGVRSRTEAALWAVERGYGTRE